jgi:MraZ protein
MLIGSHSGVISEKRRVSVPKKFLSDLGDTPIIAKWYEDCLIIVSQNFWEKLSQRLVGKDQIVNLGVRDVERFILGSAFETDPDEQGRIIIPETLSNYANLDKEVIFVGLIDRVEVWAKEVWDRKSIELAKTTKDYIEKLANS